MTNKQRLYCLSEAASYTDRDAYVSDLALSSVWEDYYDGDVPPERIAELGRLWDAYHRDVRQICAASGMSQRKCAERFCVPYRTMEDWCRGIHPAPIYVKMMMQELLGLL